MSQTNYQEINKEQTQKTNKSLSSELMSLNPSTLLTFFELDISTVEKITQSSTQGAIPASSEEKIIRFHNNKEFPRKNIIWQGKEFYPAPIQAEGFDISSRGVLPTPKLHMIVDSREDHIESLSSIRKISREYGDIIGSKITRIRTFLKYIDKENFYRVGSDVNPGLNPGLKTGDVILPNDFEPDPYAELPRDIFYVERKTNESPTEISFELSSLIDVEGIKLPRRVITSTKCSFKYRGCGCFYESEKNKGNLLKRCESENVTLLKKAPAISNNQDEIIESLIGARVRDTAWKYEKWNGNKQGKYEAGQVTYINRNDINYYYVLKKSLGQKPPAPPNEEYWIADSCSKNLIGCRQRWGYQSKADFSGSDFTKGELQFGGFPNATRINQF